jgi:5-methylcytosine-specific restriction protein A
MPLRECIERILTDYLTAAGEDFKEHPVAQFLRTDFRDTVASTNGVSDHFIFKGSAGQGVWAKGPWVGIFNPLVTITPQSGYYPVYLFREDMQGVYLSLNQGMTEAKKLYKSDAKTALRARAANFRAMLGTQSAMFPDIVIDLAPSAPSNDTAFYEAGNICAKFYLANHLPTEAQLISDLSNMLQLYQTLFEGVIRSDTGSSEDDEPSGLHFEDATKFRLHKRIERNAKLSKDVKKLQGYVCRVCGTDFEERYGAIGKGYIEAHHLKSIASIKGTKVAMDPLKDFAVLCSNCHRMVHLSGCLADIEKFKAEHYHG